MFFILPCCSCADPLGFGIAPKPNGSSNSNFNFLQAVTKLSRVASLRGSIEPFPHFVIVKTSLALEICCETFPIRINWDYVKYEVDGCGLGTVLPAAYVRRRRTSWEDARLPLAPLRLGAA